MRKILISLLICLIYTLAIGSPIATAQEELPTLRELAQFHGLKIGVAVYTNHIDNPTHADILGSQFNILTHEHEAKPCVTQNRLGQFDFRPMDEIVDFAEANDMDIHGHTLVWHQCIPDWVSAMTFTREEAIRHLRDHIYTVVGRYQGRINVWDVVNEGIDDSAGIRETPWQQMIGDDYIELAFQFAHEAAPDVKLFYNDYGIEAFGGKSDAVYNLLEDFVNRGVPVHGIGFQGHFTLGAINARSIRRNIQRFADLGLEVNFTEIDFRFNGEPNDEIMRQLAENYHTMLGICLENEACTTFIVWGLTDRFTWLRDRNLGFFDNIDVAPLLYDDDYKPKLAYFAILDLLARTAGEPPILSDDELNYVLGIETEAEAALPEPTRSDPDQLSPDSLDGRIYYAPYPHTITLDGETADWDNIPRVTVDSGPILSDDHETMTFAVAADDTHLYYLVDVVDATIVYGNYGIDEWYLEDSVEFYLNTTGDLEAPEYTEGVVQIGIMAANLGEPEDPLYGGINSDDAQVSFVVVETEDGYRVEASVPLVTDVWTIETAHEAVIGFQSHLNGSEADDRDTKLIWSTADTQDQSWQNPSLFGQLMFWDIEQ